MTDLNAMLEPGMLVRHPAQPDWGVGQVQSNIGGKITVNFREEGKVVIDAARIMLVLVGSDQCTATYGSTALIFLNLG